MCKHCDMYIEAIEHLSNYCRFLEKKVDILEKSSEKSLLKKIRNNNIAVIELENVSFENFDNVTELVFNIIKR